MPLPSINVPNLLIYAVVYFAIVHPAAWTALNAFTCSGINGNIGFILSDCACAGPLTGRRCQDCACQNNGTCTVSGGVTSCACPDAWGGVLCETCNGDNATGSCNFPCKPPHYADPVGSCTRYCNDATTCNNAGTCNAITGRCDCADKSNFYTDPNELLIDDQKQCRQSCGCQNGGYCSSKTRSGCTCPIGVGGPTCNLVCPNRCSKRGNCVPKSANELQTPRCQCFSGFVGAHCQHKCPQDSGVVCGGIQNQCVPPENDDDQDTSAARCKCQQDDGTFVTVSGNCNTFCANNGKFDPSSLKCVCPPQFTSTSRCLKCSPGYLGPGCSVHCKQDMCSGRGQCIVNANPAACECFGAGNGRFNGTLVATALNAQDTGSHARGQKVMVSANLNAVDADQSTLQVDIQVAAHGITIAHVPCFERGTTPCVIDNLGNAVLGPVSRESDVPLSFFDPVMKVGRYCNASSLLGARATCLARPLCHAYNAEANVIFDCYGKQCNGDPLALSQCDGLTNVNPVLDAYLAFSITDIKPNDVQPPDVIIPTPSPTPFATAAPTPLADVRLVSTGFTDLDTTEARVVCPKLCLSVPNGTGWAGFFEQPDPTPTNPHPSMQCACDIAIPTPSPTPAPTAPPTPSPTPSPTPDFSISRLLGLPVVTNALSLEAESVIDIAGIKEAIQDFINPNIQRQPFVMYMECRRRTAFVSLSIGDLNDQFTSFDDVTPINIVSALNTLVANACPDVVFSLDDVSQSRLRVQHVTLGATIPVVNSSNFRLLVRAGDTVPPPVSIASFDVKTVILAEQGCNRCAQNYYPAPGLTGSTVRPCTVHCEASTTCHGNGVCNDQGQCVCDTTFGQVWAKGTNCATCAIHFYPRPGRHDHITQAANQVPWCTSFCNPNMDIANIESNVLAQFVPAGYEAAVIGCSGHGQCANGLNLTLGSTVPPVRCVCDVAGTGGKAHGFRGTYCQSSCGAEQGGPICSGHGTCRTGIRCDCDDGFFGPSCEFTCSAEVFYKNEKTNENITSKCNALNSAQGGTCEAVDRYVYPVNGAQITQQLCWLDGKVDAGGNPNGAAAAQCCGLPEDTVPTDDTYRKQCNDTVREQAGVFCNATTNDVPGYCQRAQCVCHGSLAGEACDLRDCPVSVTGTQGFSACGSALEVGECQHGECVPDPTLPTRLGRTSQTPYTFDPNDGVNQISTPGVCECHRQPLTSDICQDLLSAGNASYSALCCPGPVPADSRTSDVGLEVYHGPACSVDCACSRRSTGTCSSESGVPGEQPPPKPCQCRRTSGNTDLFCGDSCTRTCPGISASVLQLQPFCKNAEFNSPRITDGCYDLGAMQAPDSPIAKSSFSACSGHGKCVQSNCDCQCLGFTTSTVYGAVYNTMQLFQGDACELTCPGVTDSLVDLAREIDGSQSDITSIERSVLLNTFATQYQSLVCSGHGFCGTESTGCTCVGGYTGDACETLGCTSQSTAASLTPDAQTEIDDYGFRVCGRGTCSNNKCVCDDPTRFDATTTLWSQIPPDKAERFQKFQRLLDVPCLKCANDTYSSRFQYALLDVHAHLPSQVMTMLGGSVCDTHIPSKQAGCCRSELVQDFDAIIDGLQHAGCPEGKCEKAVQTGAACDTCLLGLRFDSDCNNRCSMCLSTESVLPVAVGQITSALILESETTGCTSCVGGGDNQLDPAILPLDIKPQQTVCSGHGQCIGSTTTWHGNSGSQTANVVNPNPGDDVLNTTLCRCDEGYAGALCGKVTDKNHCTRGGDNAATLLSEGLCVCSDYTQFGGPWCDKLAVNAALFVSEKITVQKNEAGDPVRVPPKVVSVNGKAVLCNGRGMLATCSLGPDSNDVRFCKAAPEAKPQPPCRCFDAKYDPELNCLDFTAEEEQNQIRLAHSRWKNYVSVST